VRESEFAACGSFNLPNDVVTETQKGKDTDSISHCTGDESGVN
jgi:hypothetical protein